MPSEPARSQAARMRLAVLNPAIARAGTGVGGRTTSRATDRTGRSELGSLATRRLCLLVPSRRPTQNHAALVDATQTVVRSARTPAAGGSRSIRSAPVANAHDAINIKTRSGKAVETSFDHERPMRHPSQTCPTETPILPGIIWPKLTRKAVKNLIHTSTAIKRSCHRKAPGVSALALPAGSAATRGPYGPRPRPPPRWDHHEDDAQNAAAEGDVDQRTRYRRSHDGGLVRATMGASEDR